MLPVLVRLDPELECEEELLCSSTPHIPGKGGGVIPGKRCIDGAAELALNPGTDLCIEEPPLYCPIPAVLWRMSGSGGIPTERLRINRRAGAGSARTAVVQILAASPSMCLSFYLGLGPTGGLRETGGAAAAAAGGLAVICLAIAMLARITAA